MKRNFLILIICILVFTVIHYCYKKVTKVAENFYNLNIESYQDYYPLLSDSLLAVMDTSFSFSATKGNNVFNTYLLSDGGNIVIWDLKVDSVFSLDSTVVSNKGECSISGIKECVVIGYRTVYPVNVQPDIKFKERLNILIDEDASIKKIIAENNLFVLKCNTKQISFCNEKNIEQINHDSEHGDMFTLVVLCKRSTEQLYIILIQTHKEIKTDIHSLLNLE